ncbi:hypothetical protein N7470_006118 [Penicillium chermesinum]|nr:hypothetical protein N7470_006118 [Penicillium chermesinum]
MSRRPPPSSEYFDEEAYSMEHEPYARSRRREREFEDDVDYRRRRRSMPPEEEMERLHISSQRPPPIPREPPRTREIEEDTFVEEQEDELVVEERERRGSRRPRFEEEDVPPRRRERGSHRGYDSELERRGSRLEDDRDEMVSRSSKRGHRPRRREPELEELLDDDPAPELRSVDPITKQRIMQWQDQPGPDEIEEEDGLPPPGAFPSGQEEFIDEEVAPRPRIRPGSLPEAIEDEEIMIRRDERSKRRGSSERDEAVARRSKRNSPQERMRTPEVVMPPVHEDFPHPEEYEPSRLPRAPSPGVPPTITSFEEVDVRRQSSRRGRKAEEDIALAREEDDESISPTSGPVEFHNPFPHGDRPRRRKPRSRRESESMAAGSSRIRGARDVPRELDEQELDRVVNEDIVRARSHVEHDPRDSASLVVKSRSRRTRDMPGGFEEDDEEEDDEEEEVEIHERSSRTRPRGNGHVRDSLDEWSVVRAPSKEDAAEMSGGLDIVEVAPRGASSADSHSEGDDEETEQSEHTGTQVSKDRDDERWTEITKDLVVREAIERLGYEFEETRRSYYIFSFLESHDIDELVELSDVIRKARRRRIREMQRERAMPIPPRPASLVDPRIPLRPRYGGERRIREREWIVPPYH